MHLLQPCQAWFLVQDLDSVWDSAIKARTKPRHYQFSKQWANVFSRAAVREIKSSLRQERQKNGLPELLDEDTNSVAILIEQVIGPTAFLALL